jgi:predicted transposase/invertase (TIGR01784 family)
MEIVINEENYHEVLRKMDEHEYSLKTYRDWENIIDTAKREARLEGEQNKTEKFALAMYQENLPMEIIIRITGLTEEEITHIINRT